MANGNGKIDIWVVLVVLLVLYAVVPAFQNTVNGLLGGIGGTGTGGGTTLPPAPTLPCPIEDVTVTVTSFDLYSQNSDITNGSHRVFVGGTDKGYVAEGGSVTVAPENNVKVIFGENSTSHYSVVKEQTAPCAGTLEISAGLVAYDNSPSFTIWTEEGQVQSATANNQSMATDTVYNNPLRIKSTSKTSLGNPTHPDKGNIVCLQYNRTAYDSMSIDGADPSLTPNAVPAQASYKESCYYIPVIPNDPNDGNDGEWNGEIVTDTSATWVGGTDAQYANVTIYDTDLDLDADTLAIIYGVEDEDKNDIGSLASGATIIGTKFRIST